MAGEYQKKLLRKQQKELRKLKCFLFPSVALLLIPLLIIIVLLYKGAFYPPFWLPLIYILFTDTANTIRQICRFCAFFRALQNDVCKEDVLRDFRDAMSIGWEEIKLGSVHLYKRTGFLQFGKQYVFGWKGAVPVRYEDIQRIYVCSHVASAISINELLPRNPVYVTTEKGEQYMGTIPDDSLDYYVTFLREKNPLIQYCIMKPGRFGRNNRYIPYDEYWKNVQEKAERKHRSIEHWKSVLKKASRKQ